MRQRSRLVRYRSRQSSKQVLVYLTLSILFVVALVKFGVPAFIQLVSWWSGKDAPKQEVELGIPPQTPVLGVIPEATFSSQIKVSGLAQPQMTVRLSVNGESVDEVTSDDGGSFEFEKVALDEGENILEVVSIDGENRESVPARAVVVVDKKAPVIVIGEPENEATLVGSSAQNLTIKGKVDDKDTEVKINGGYVQVGLEGVFEYRVRLKEGLNEFVIVAKDKAGNVSEQLLRVTWSL